MGLCFRSFRRQLLKTLLASLRWGFDLWCLVLAELEAFRWIRDKNMQRTLRQLENHDADTKWLCVRIWLGNARQAKRKLSFQKARIQQALQNARRGDQVAAAECAHAWRCVTFFSRHASSECAEALGECTNSETPARLPHLPLAAPPEQPRPRPIEAVGLERSSREQLVS